MVYLCFTLEGLAELIRKFAPFRVSIALSQTQLALVDRVKTVFMQGRPPKSIHHCTQARLVKTFLCVVPIVSKRWIHCRRRSSPSQHAPSQSQSSDEPLPQPQSTASTSTLPSSLSAPSWLQSQVGMHCVSGHASGVSSHLLASSATSNRKDQSPIQTSPTPQSPAPPCLLGTQQQHSVLRHAHHNIIFSSASASAFGAQCGSVPHARQALRPNKLQNCQMTPLRPP